ncbi:hypothetical protein FLA4_04580 [Candidatus Rickettsia kotlanii]|nr:hypothetical protein FLA4_04580 [Candidatus Rickettsia kotlanii]BDU61291.1 hypothetical protein HM2_04590 [Candidatus Rickettsia kotlanii]
MPACNDDYLPNKHHNPYLQPQRAVQNALGAPLAYGANNNAKAKLKLTSGNGTGSELTITGNITTTKTMRGEVTFVKIPDIMKSAHKPNKFLK